MKYLLLLGVVLGVLWLLRQARNRKLGDTAGTEAAKPPATPSPTEIVACAHCGVHLPRQDALPGTQGRHYCGASHQREAEGG